MDDRRSQILVIDDEANLRRVLGAQLARDGHEILEAEDGAAGLALLEEHHVDLVITDLRMPGLDGLEVLRRTAARSPRLPVIVLTAHGTVDTAVEALKRGAFDFLTKPFDQTDVRAVVQKALRSRDLSRADSGDEGGLGAPAATALIGSSDVIREVDAFVARLADTPTTVVLTGESGTGKELVAQLLHARSSRRERPFIAVNCAAVPPEQLDAELFGVAAGADGAVGRPGRFELAATGTLFLAEIDALPAQVQVKLLRALQEGGAEPVGGVEPRAIDVRLVVACADDLRDRVRAGTFREDLFYRLNVAPIRLPPLRERASDIMDLVAHFLGVFGARLGKRITTVTADAARVLERWTWPGNVRELEQVVERAVLFSDGPEIDLAQLPEELLAADPPTPAGGLKDQVRAEVARIERELVARALQQTGGNVTHAAKLLKYSRKGLQLKMKALGLRERDPSASD